MNLNELASSIYNDIVGGAIIPKSNIQFLDLDQISDECIEVRDSVIKELYLKGLLRKEEMATAINCVAVDCKDQNKCSCNVSLDNPKMAKHFEIPQLLTGLGEDSLLYIGSTDRSTPYKVYYSLEATKCQQHYDKYRRRKSKKPFVYLERTPNENGNYDGWIFDAPFVQNIAVIGIFKDPRKLEQYNCCNEVDYLEMGSITTEIKNRIINKKVQLYRAVNPPAPVV